MIIEIKQQNSGSYPTFLNYTTYNTKFQVKDDITARLNNFSSCNITFSVEAKSKPEKQNVKYK